MKNNSRNQEKHISMLLTQNKASIISIIFMLMTILSFGQTKVYISGNGTGTYNCDGVDDQIQINQAIALVEANPTLYSGVYLKGPFTYNISGTIFVYGTLEGDSTAVVKLVDNAGWGANVPLLKNIQTGLDGIIIRGFTIDGNRSGNSSVASGAYYYNLISISSCTNISVYNMYLTNNTNDGLNVTSCTNVQYYNNTIYCLGHDGLYATNSSNIEAYNNKITCRTNSGLRLYNTDNVKLHDNVITTIPGSGGVGIEIQKEGTPTMANIEVYNNQIYSTRLAGIWAFSSSSYDASTTNLNIHNNVIYGTGTNSSNSAAGGMVINGFNAIIENNDFDGSYYSGIGIREAYATPTITGTITITIRNNNITNTSGYGIEYTTLANHTIVQENNCLYQNSSGAYSNVTAPIGSDSNLTEDPLYADRANHDYHLKSQYGRWNGSAWVNDAVTSPCIDAGYASSSYSNEPLPNGGRINIGAYGNTAQASKSQGSVPPSPTVPDLVGYWQFEEASGAIVHDSSTCINNGTISGSPSQTTGICSMAFDFNGTSDYITVPGSSSINAITSEITMTVWVNFTSTGSSQNIMERWLCGAGVDERAFNLYINATGNILFGLSNDGTSTNSKWLTSQDSVIGNQWTHVAATSDGTSMKIYINGVLDANTLVSPSSIFVPSGDVHICKWEYSSTSWINSFKGALDDIKLYHRALTLQEIQNEYSACLTTGIARTDNNKTISIYPNPVSNELTIETEGNNGRKDFEILNSTGQVIFKGNILEKAVVNTTGFAPGIYLIRVKNGLSGMSSRKLLIVKN